MKKILTILILSVLSITGYCDYVVQTVTCGSNDYTRDATGPTYHQYYKSYTIPESGTYYFVLTTGHTDYISMKVYDILGQVYSPVLSYTSNPVSVNSGNYEIAISFPPDIGGSMTMKIYKPSVATEDDQDGDGIPDDIDDDDDGDGIPDVNDPDHPDYDPNHPNSDPDGDGIPNEDDPDDDGDGVPDEDDPDTPQELEFAFKELTAWETIKQKLTPSVDGSFSSSTPVFNIPIELENVSCNITLDFNNPPSSLASGISILKECLRIFCKIVFSWVFVLSIFKFLNK